MKSFIEFVINHWVLWSLLAVVVVLILIEELRSKKGSARLSPKEVTQLINRENAVLIDLRDKDAFVSSHIVDAVNLTAEDVSINSPKLKKYKGKPIILVATNETQANRILVELRKQGMTAYLLAGGVTAWRGAGFPVVKGA